MGAGAKLGGDPVPWGLNRVKAGKDDVDDDDDEGPGRPPWTTSGGCECGTSPGPGWEYAVLGAACIWGGPLLDTVGRPPAAIGGGALTKANGSVMG